MPKKFLFSWLYILSAFVTAQNLTVTPLHTTLSDTLNSEMVFKTIVTNTSQSNQDVFVVRAINDIPQTWYSALCFESCFPTEMDSVATTASFNSTSLIPGESREIALHVFPLVSGGTGNIQLHVGDFNSTVRTIIDLVANVNVVSIKDDKPFEFYLSNNYPNPFNPSTKIKLGIRTTGHVSLRVYNVQGIEVTRLVDEIIQSGNYEVSFDSGTLSSGIYFYKLVTNGFTANGKMILEK